MSQEQPGQEAGGEWPGDVGSHIPSTADTQGRLRLGSDLNTFSIQELTGAPGLMLSRHCTPPGGWGGTLYTTLTGSAPGGGVLCRGLAGHPVGRTTGDSIGQVVSSEGTTTQAGVTGHSDLGGILNFSGPGNQRWGAGCCFLRWEAWVPGCIPWCGGAGRCGGLLLKLGPSGHPDPLFRSYPPV